MPLPTRKGPTCLREEFAVATNGTAAGQSTPCLMVDSSVLGIRSFRFSAVDACFQKSGQAMEITILLDKANLGDQRFGIDKFLKGDVVQIQLA